MDKNDAFHQTPSPTNPNETLGQSESRVEQDIETYIAQGGQPWEDKGQALIKEGEELIAADPPEEDNLSDAVATGTVENAMNGIASEFDALPEGDEDDE